MDLLYGEIRRVAEVVSPSQAADPDQISTDPLAQVLAQVMTGEIAAFAT
jgi:hypothetical protein